MYILYLNSNFLFNHFTWLENKYIKRKKNPFQLWIIKTINLQNNNKPQRCKMKPCNNNSEPLINPNDPGSHDPEVKTTEFSCNQLKPCVMSCYQYTARAVPCHQYTARAVPCHQYTAKATYSTGLGVLRCAADYFIHFIQ